MNYKIIDMEKYYKKIDFKNIDIPFDIKEKIKILYEEVKIFNFSSLPCGVIHNDIFPDNIFVKDNKIVGILDFNEAQTAPFIIDLAIVINFWIRVYQFDLEVEKRYIDIFLEEYEKYRKLEEREKRALDMALKKMALTFILLRLDKFINENLSEVFIENKSYTQLLPLLEYY